MKARREKIIKNPKIPIRIEYRNYKFPYRTYSGYHKEVEIHIIKKGEGYYIIGNKKYPIQNNCCIIIYPEQIHFYVPSNSSEIIPMEKILIQFLPSILRKIHISIKTFPHLFPLNELEIFQIEKILKNIIQETKEKKKYFEKIIFFNIFQLLYLLKRCSYKEKEFYYENPILNKIIDYIDTNIEKNIKIEDIAKFLSYSKSHISHIFKQFTGISLKQYILYKKVIEAQKILEKYKDVKVKLLASKLGFSDFSLFNRIFKKITGFTPYSYKKYCIK